MKKKIVVIQIVTTGQTLAPTLRGFQVTPGMTEKIRFTS